MIEIRNIRSAFLVIACALPACVLPTTAAAASDSVDRRVAAQPNGEVVILSDRDLVFEKLRPTPPEFQLAGDAERVAITCAAIGVDAGDLDLPVPLDRTAYRRAVTLLSDRGLVEHGRLTPYGREVEAMQFAEAHKLAAALVVFSFAVLLALLLVERRQGRRAP